MPATKYNNELTQISAIMREYKFTVNFIPA